VKKRLYVDGELLGNALGELGLQHYLGGDDSKSIEVLLLLVVGGFVKKVECERVHQAVTPVLAPSTALVKTSVEKVEDNNEPPDFI
jgi:hypothetical protein